MAAYLGSEKERRMDPTGKVALVTGGGSGIGRATALALAEAGAAVVIADIDDGGGQETVALIERSNGKAAFVHTDVTNREDLERMVAFAEETFGGLDVLHNNAGITTGQPRFPDVLAERWEQAFAVNLWAVIAGTQAAVPAMRRRGGGVIVNTASLAGVIRYEQDPIYATTKHGIVGLTRALVFLKDEANIRVNCVCPAVVNTPMLTRDIGDLTTEERAQRDAIIGQMPLIQPGEVAEAVLEFIRDDSLAGEAMGIMHGRPHKLIPPAITLRHDPTQSMPG
jgi:NAD(P)-dependent dehydrogenase (short-subunit alcohol dehydrogenase family)